MELHSTRDDLVDFLLKLLQLPTDNHVILGYINLVLTDLENGTNGLLQFRELLLIFIRELITPFD
jgi:hypothetical protein